MLRLVDPIASDGIVVQPDKERDGTRDMDEGVDPIDPPHGQRVPKKNLLNAKLPEDSQLLLHLNQCEGMASGNVDRVFFKGHCGECTAELICLYV